MDYLIQNSSAFAAMVNGSSYGTQKLIDAKLHTAVSSYLSGLSIWQVLLTMLLVAVGYDQCMPASLTLPCPFRILIAFAVMYQRRKGPLAGPMFKIPLVGPFLPALYPDFEKYKRQWASGDLSCVSVFHKSVLKPKPLWPQSPTHLLILNALDSWY